MLKAVAVIFFSLAAGGMPFAAQAFDIHAPEALRYRVGWGPLSVGRVELDYVPQKVAKGTEYSLRAHVKDQSALLDMDDVWQSNGNHGKRLFVPVTYEVLQKENSYRADKVMTFDAKEGEIRYLNRRDVHDAVEPLPWDGAMRDALSAVYAWRMLSLEELKKGGKVEVMGVKRPFTLMKAPARREKVVLAGKKVDVWSVDLTTAVGGKISKESWTVKLRDDGKLTPVVVVARTKFGTFKATLKE
jgi:hypothetical protein